MIDKEMVKLGLACKCPKCKKGDLYKPGFSLSLRDVCDECGLDLSKNDSADGPAVFLITIFCFSLVPIALIVAAFYSWPLWVHAVVWTVITVALTVGMLRQTKAYIIALQFKHRASDWDA